MKEKTRTNIQNVTVGFIGCGAMGSAVIRSLSQCIPARNIAVSAAHYENAAAIADRTDCRACKTNSDAAKADYLFLAVKPSSIKQVGMEIAANMSDDSVIISFAAGITLHALSQLFPNKHIIRAMPNLPASVGEAMIALCCNNDVPKQIIETASALLETAGIVERVPEKLIDCVTAVSGAGPAYAFIFMEALADAAVRCGMPRSQAYIYAAQTFKGSAEMMLKDGRCPSELKDAVCSPAGATIEGVAVLEKAGVRGAIIEAVAAACLKSKSI